MPYLIMLQAKHTFFLGYEYVNIGKMKTETNQQYIAMSQLI